MLKKIKIKKRSGVVEYFNIEKLIRALMRAGANEDLASRIAHSVLSRVDRGASTQDIYNLAKQYLKKAHPIVGARFSLREAILRLGPAGYDFEKYIMLLFKDYGYTTYLPEILHGKCVDHEVDVIAEKDGKRIIMECKLRKGNDVHIRIKDVLSTWARFVDLCEGYEIGSCKKIDQAWMVTNSRFSGDALKYGACKNMKLISWNTPYEMPLPAYIDSRNLYPITILNSIKRYHLRVLSRCDILLLRDLVDIDYLELCERTSLSRIQLEPIVNEAKEILSFKGL
ncbi:restriction endonuclease [Patescibacteria group bacterium]|nr:restriction endonuclease [Patescibacteria group bacterium]